MCFIHFPTSNDFFFFSFLFWFLLFYFIPNKGKFPAKPQTSVVENNKGNMPKPHNKKLGVQAKRVLCGEREMDRKTLL